jgi:hypothetical protein
MTEKSLRRQKTAFLFLSQRAGILYDIEPSSNFSNNPIARKHRRAQKQDSLKSISFRKN